jgi:AraC family transcriptional regulator
MLLPPKLELFPEINLIGNRITMSLQNNKTADLWKNFMPLLKEIPDLKKKELYSVQNYPAGYFENFNPAAAFEKWAAVEIENAAPVPNKLEGLSISAGLYAIFHYRGSSTDSSIFQYIFTEWLPSSGYVLDSRPHFEILGEKYRNADPGSEEDIYIPVKSKQT